MGQGVKVFLSLGGNVGDVFSHINNALSLMAEEKQIWDLRCSHFYRTAPVGVVSDTFFVNAVCSFETSFSLKDLFMFTVGIERKMGKRSQKKNEPRTLDIDILFYGLFVGQEDDVQIPHPRWKERLFVLIPLSELIERIELVEEGEKRCYVINELAREVKGQSVELIS